MKANYLKQAQKAQVSRQAFGRFMQRATIDECLDKKIKEHEAKRMDELSAFAGAVDANWLYTLHTDPSTRYGRKKLRHIWESMVKNRIAFREFYRDGHSQYQEQPTGQNVEDEATVQALLSIGVDIKAWEREEIVVDHATGEVSFRKSEGGAEP